MNNKKISVIVPIYNELKNIEQLIVRLSDALTTIGIPYEIIFVDDHSTDGTYEYLERFKKSKKIVLQRKVGKKGKAFSLIEGFQKASGSILAMIDADLQYPPEEIPKMVNLLEKADVVVAKRANYKGSLLRKILSSGFKLFFGKALFGLDHDIQSGLKVFTREAIETVKFNPTSEWTFDLEFLHRCREAGFIIKEHDVVFGFRKKGTSKIGLLKGTWEIGINALLLRFKRIDPVVISPKAPFSMIGAGVGYRKKKYITHTTLQHQISALKTFSLDQKIILTLIAIDIAIGLIFFTVSTLQIVVGILSFIYFVDVLFNLYLTLRSLHVPQEIYLRSKELEGLDERTLPIYSILCPLYREAHVIPQFLDAIGKLDWPKDKLDVMLLLEEDDKETIDAVSKMSLPQYVRQVIVPHSMPKTKPKACNYGLTMAKGEYIVIYDAEDIPEHTQLKKAYLSFQKVGKDVICLQAKLNYYNPHHNLLTRFFTAEYSLWFDITLTGLQSINTSIPLGGTSNHFKTNDLKKLQGWDPFNVTEDADLGVRLFKQGYKTAMIDSTTLEEANSRFGNWMRQRSRWLKGYMQTYLVHTRELFGFANAQGIHSIVFHLIIGGKIAFILINPILWIATVSYFSLYAYVGAAIETLYPSVVFYMAVTSLIFGNFMFLYYYMVGCAKRNQWALMKYVFLIPIYWLMISIAAVIALYQLLFRPHYWEKTVHGFHLLKRQKLSIARLAIKTLEQEEQTVFPIPFYQRFVKLINSKKVYIGGSFLIAASVAANFLNFLFNAYLGRTLDLASFGLVSLVSSFLYISLIPFAALSASVNYRSGFLEARFGEKSARFFWNWVRKKSFLLSLIVCGLWIAISPFLMSFFKENDVLPFLIFTPVWLIGFMGAVDRGFLSGRVMFGFLGIVALTEPIGKLAATFIFVSYNLSNFVYSAIPIAIVLSYIASYIFVNLKKEDKKDNFEKIEGFPKKFFVSSLLSGLSTITFLSLDIILAKHYLSPEDAGRYALISLVGKMVFFLGSLASQFTVSLVARSEGARKDSTKTFTKILLSTYLLCVVGFLAVGVFGHITVPILFGENALSIVSYLPLFAFAMLLFSISKVFVSYYQTKRLYSFSIVTFFLAVVQIVLISINHQSIQSIVMAMTITGGLNFIVMALLHLKVGWVRIFENNVSDFLSIIFEKTESLKVEEKQLRILIFNWRDTKHAWAGGAESYIHELSKRWVEMGNRVTVFCGNDAHNPRKQVIDGVEIIRRGGKYMVYFWAFLYYILRFRGKFDIIIDSENGIPFFTPLYTRIPVFLLIHHVHQEVFRKQLIFPFSSLAQFLEAKLMPFVYRDNMVITVSESSKKEIIDYGIAKKEFIEIVHPGVDHSKFIHLGKTEHPSFIYLGRLKPYKNIDVAIVAFSRVVKLFPSAMFYVVGEGESMKSLKKLTVQLKIENRIRFYGKVSEGKKAKLLAKSWVAIQPSMVEGWGITVIEANASGTPVIASDVNGLRDSVIDRQTGVLVEAKNSEAIASAMRDFIIDKTYREIISKQAHVWSQNFNWDISSQIFYRVIISSLGQRVKLGVFRGAGSLLAKKYNG